MVKPSSGRTGSCVIVINSRFVFSSFRKSFLFPTKIIGTFEQKCFTLKLIETTVLEKVKKKKKIYVRTVYNALKKYTLQNFSGCSKLMYTL